MLLTCSHLVQLNHQMTVVLIPWCHPSSYYLTCFCTQWCCISLLVPVSSTKLGIGREHSCQSLSCSFWGQYRVCVESPVNLMLMCSRADFTQTSIWNQDRYCDMDLTKCNEAIRERFHLWLRERDWFREFTENWNWNKLYLDEHFSFIVFHCLV